MEDEVKENVDPRTTIIDLDVAKIDSSEWLIIHESPSENSTEGGLFTYHLSADGITKIIELNYGEMFKDSTVYYLANGALIYVYEMEVAYNRPIYYDSTEMVLNGDDQAWSLELSVTNISRNYFENNVIFRRFENGDCGSPFNGSYLQEMTGTYTWDAEELGLIKRVLEMQEQHDE